MVAHLHDTSACDNAYMTVPGSRSHTRRIQMVHAFRIAGSKQQLRALFRINTDKAARTCPPWPVLPWRPPSLPLFPYLFLLPFLSYSRKRHPLRSSPPPPFSPYITHFPPATLDFRILSLPSFNLPHASLRSCFWHTRIFSVATVCIWLILHLLTVNSTLINSASAKKTRGRRERNSTGSENIKENIDKSIYLFNP